MMDSDKAVALIEETIIYGLRTPDYERNVEVARLSRMWLTGEGQDTEYLMKVRDKETDREKTIRVKATKPITPFALNPVRTEFDRVFRADGIVKEVGHDDPEKEKVISAKLGNYFAEQSIHRYFEEKYYRKQFEDPNAWHLTVFRRVERDGVLKDIVPYPLEVSSEQAINYHYENGVPVWLIVMVAREERYLDGGELKTETVHDYYFYAAGIEIKYTRYKYAELPEGKEVVNLECATGNGLEPSTFTREVFKNTGTTEFIGNKFGSYPDPETNGNTMVPPYWQGAKYLLEKLINMNTSFEVSVFNHVYPKLFHYDYQCTYSEIYQDEELTCERGYLGGFKGKECPKCKGGGGSMHVSESDIITFDLTPFMDDLSKMPDLSKIAHYVQPPLDVTNELWNWLNEYRKWVYVSAFNSGSLEKVSKQMTAEEVDKLWEEKNTRIYPSVLHLARLTERAVRICAQYLEADEGLKVRFFVPPQLKLEPLGVLLARYERAKTAGLPYEVLWDIQCSIFSKTMLDSPDRVAEIKAWEHWRPFRSHAREDVSIILSTRSHDDPEKVLWENWDSVKREVSEALSGKKENGRPIRFFELKRPAQKKYIGDAVKVIAGNVLVDKVEPLTMPTPTPDFENEDEAETVESSQI